MALRELQGGWCGQQAAARNRELACRVAGRGRTVGRMPASSGFLRPLATALALVAACASALADPLSDLLAKGGGTACYERIYDTAHLAANPRQRTRGVTLSLRPTPDARGAVFRLRFERADGMRYLVGDCSWEAEANLDVMGKPLIPAFKGPSGLDCHAITSEDGASAEEGGDFPIDLRDGRSIVVYTPEDLAGWPSLDRSGPARFFTFGKDDRIFRVDATDPGTCRDLERTLKWIE